MPLSFEQFKDSLSGMNVPEGLNPLLQALWYDAKGDWHKAHGLVDDMETPDGAWVHAYLHRKEGDQSNASYWYQRAKRKMPFVLLRKNGTILRTSL